MKVTTIVLLSVSSFLTKSAEIPKYVVEILFLSCLLTNIFSLLEILEDQKLSLVEEVVCGNQWVQQCQRVAVDFRLHAVNIF